MLAGFLAYFENQWVGIFRERRTGRPKNKIPWSYFDSVEEDGLKTTSSLEGWHNQFSRIVGKKNPSFGKLVDSLIIQQTDLKNDIHEIQLGMPKAQTKRAHLVKKEKIYNIIKKGYSTDNLMKFLSDVADALSFFHH